MRALLLAFACGGFASAYRVCDVVDYGAVGDGATQNIVAIRAALADCSDADGTLPRRPPGSVSPPEGAPLS